MNGSLPETEIVRPRESESKGRLLRAAFSALLWAAAVGLCAAYAYFSIFSRFHSYDDEGFILISLKWFFAGHALYDQVYSCYQPGFYVVHWLIFQLCGAQLSHDNIRLLTLVFWMGGAGLNGLTTYRLTRNAILSVLVLLLSTRCLDGFANEPGHPQALAYVVVAGLTTLLTFAEELPRWVLSGAVGVAVGLLLLIKINVGVFAFVAVSFVLALGQERRSGLWLKGLAAATMFSLPLALMHSRISLSTLPLPVVCGLAILVPLLISSVLLNERRLASCAILLCIACGFMLPLIDARSPAILPFFSLCVLTLSIASLVMACLACSIRGANRILSPAWLVVGAAALTAMVLLIVMLRGTSMDGLLSGMWLIPSGQSRSFFVPWHSNMIGAWSGLAGAASCVLYAVRRQPGRSGRLGNLLLSGGKLAFGSLVLLELYVREPGSRPLMPLDYRLPHFWMLPFAWLAVAEFATGAAKRVGAAGPDTEPGKRQEPASGGNGHPGIGLGRLALASVAVLQPLIAYPVAGTQLIPGSILLAILAAVCLQDVWARVEAPLGRVPFRRFQPALSVALKAVLVVLFARETLNNAQIYHSLTPLQLPGAQRVRLSADEVRTFQEVVRPLARPEVETFLTLPGLNSLYFWAEKEAPTGLNTTTWMTLLDAAEQERIWEAARERPGLMAVRNRALARYWLRGRSPKEAPLARHIDESFQPMITNGSYELLIRR